jgi:hypothetical protein
MAIAISNANKWKYLSFALIGILAAGSTVSFVPQQASAHITTNVQHMLEHIYAFVDGIEAKTNNLPADPASNTVVNTRASQTSVNTLQTTANAIKAKTDGLSTGGGGSDFQIIRSEINSADSNQDSVVCTSNSDFMIYVSASEVGGSDGNELVSVSDNVNFVYDYMLINHESYVFSAKAGENYDVGLSHAIATTQDKFSQATVTLQTAEGATASCTER